MIFFMNKRILFGMIVLLSVSGLFSQSAYPKIEIEIQEQNGYTRHPRLEEEDLNNNTRTEFSQGLEIICDLERVSVYISDSERGITPYENSDMAIGYYRIKLVKSGTDDLIFWVNIKKDKRTTVTVQYLPDETEKSSENNREAVIRKGTDYLRINPSDPLYYRRILFSKELFTDNKTDLILTDEENTPLITLYPYNETDSDYIYYWNGLDIDGITVDDGMYALYSVSDFAQKSYFYTDQRFSRKAASYFSGFSGLSLVPSAQPIFHKSFQFGSLISSEMNMSDSDQSTNLPFSFFLRLSPLQKWEAAFDGEVSIHPDNSVPLIKLNTSQKILITGNGPFLFSVNGRLSYRANINDFKELVYNAMVRDPAGASLAFPVQFKINLWDFYMAPEAIYSYESIIPGEGAQDDDFLGALRWGVSYTDRYVQAGFSSVIFSSSVRETPIVMQSALDCSIFFPQSPLYLSAYLVYQEIRNGDQNRTIGMGMGFLL